jgi:hypothetical protein
MALTAARSVQPEEQRIIAITHVAREALQLAPDVTSDAIRELPSGIQEKRSLISSYLEALLEVERLDEAIAWADALGDEWSITVGREKIAAMFAESSPQKALNFLNASSFKGTGVSPEATHIIQAWVETDPSEALAWATKLPAGEARGAGYKVIFSRWIFTETPQALTWAASQTNPRVKEEALAAVVAALNEQPDPVRSHLLDSVGSDLRIEIEERLSQLIQDQAAESESEVEPGQE